MQYSKGKEPPHVIYNIQSFPGSYQEPEACQTVSSKETPRVNERELPAALQVFSVVNKLNLNAPTHFMLMTSLSLCPFMCKDKHGGNQSRNAGTLDSVCGLVGLLLVCLLAFLFY